MKNSLFYLIDSLYGSNWPFFHKIGQRVIITVKRYKLGGLKYKDIPTDRLWFSTKKNIPPLAWSCKVSNEKYSFDVGHSVEASSTRIIEGAWDGDFETSKIEESDFVYGSGATLKDGKVIFIPPKHGLESIFVLYDKKLKKYNLSNSMCFLLVSAKVSTNSKFFQKLASVIHESSKTASELGIDKYNRVIAEDNRYVMYNMMYYNFSVSTNGAIKLYVTKPKIYFKGYEQYRNFLLEKARTVSENASSKTRRARYLPVSAISKGYDSPAVSVIAQEIGASNALTLDVSVYGFNDSGEEIANLLGLKPQTYKHILSDQIDQLNLDFTSNHKEKALEFIATYGIGDDVAFLPFEDQLKNKIYMSGTYGDVIWKKAKKLTPGFSKLVFEKSLTEFRLRVGFINFPLISVGARFPAQILKITNNDVSMQKYSVGGEYDRPIPRKMVEDAGVPRELFGIQKSATSPLITNHKELFGEAIKKISTRYTELARTTGGGR